MCKGNIFFSSWNDTFLRRISVSYRHSRKKRSKNHLVIHISFFIKVVVASKREKNNWQIFSLTAVDAIQFWNKVAGNTKVLFILFHTVPKKICWKYEIQPNYIFMLCRLLKLSKRQILAIRFREYKHQSSLFFEDQELLWLGTQKQKNVVFLVDLLLVNLNWKTIVTSSKYNKILLTLANFGSLLDNDVIFCALVFSRNKFLHFQFYVFWVLYKCFTSIL